MKDIKHECLRQMRLLGLACYPGSDTLETELVFTSFERSLKLYNIYNLVSIVANIFISMFFTI